MLKIFEPFGVLNSLMVGLSRARRMVAVITGGGHDPFRLSALDSSCVRL